MNDTDQSKELLSATTLPQACILACGRAWKQIEQAKHTLVAEFSSTFAAHHQLLTLAIVEADALAHQTEYPHLLFPQLAMEKVQRAASWQKRQHRLLESTSPYALAA